MSGTWNPGPGGTSGSDTFAGSAGSDTAFGGLGNDSLSGLVGDDYLRGDSGDDTLLGGDGNDTLVGDDGTTVLAGGNDYLDGGIGNDQLFGNGGNDTLLGGAGNDTIFGNDGNDSIVGGTGDDLLLGGAGNDTIIGSDGGNSDGNNTISGGAGNDVMTGANGNDIFVVSLQQGQDTLNSGGGQDSLFLQGYAGPSGWSSLKDSVYGAWSFKSGTGNSGTFTNVADTLNSVFVTNAVNFLGDTISMPPDTAPCFASGTMIATARGEVAVENLRVGDLVVTAGGGGALQPVVWKGHSDVNIARHNRPEAVQPILIKAGALAKGVPFHDLRVSPEHAMFLDGFLVPAGLLVNGTTIVQEAWCSQVTYWHVELPSHGLLVAEGALTESYLDDGNRKHFDNGAIASLFKDFASERANGVYDREACYPLLRHGARLEKIRARLATRTEKMGAAMPAHRSKYTA